jgi:hypothetical protein
VILYWCEICSLVIREANKLRVFGNTMPRRIFGSKRGEMVRGYRTLRRNACRMLVGTPEGKRPLRRPRTI